MIINNLMVDRLLEFWLGLDGAREIIEDTAWLDKVKPIEFREEHERDDAYDQRRVQHFVEHLRAGLTIDPIMIDNVCHGMRVYPIPVFLDGNHRLIAHVLLGRTKIPACYGGRVDLLRYLEGKRKTRPSE